MISGYSFDAKNAIRAGNLAQQGGATSEHPGKEDAQHQGIVLQK
jgi:hypothetical protein